jgi:hypothetical protein
MTEQQLAEIEAREWPSASCLCPAASGEPCPLAAEDCAKRRYGVPELVAEVRRLQGLVKAVEWRGGYDIRVDEYDTCPWCYGEKATAARPHAAGHKPTCPAFGKEPA